MQSEEAGLPQSRELGLNLQQTLREWEEEEQPEGGCLQLSWGQQTGATEVTGELLQQPHHRTQPSAAAQRGVRQRPAAELPASRLSRAARRAVRLSRLSPELPEFLRLLPQPPPQRLPLMLGAAHGGGWAEGRKEKEASGRTRAPNQLR